MKTFRIVTDSFSGYEAQVKYHLFPFLWFQLNDKSGVNTWNSPEQALEFIHQKRAGLFIREKSIFNDMWNDCHKEVKSFLSENKLILNREVVWQELPTINRLPTFFNQLIN